MKTLAVLVAVALLLVALAYFAPASMLDARLGVATRGELRLVNAAGTVWNGRGLLTNERNSWSLPVSWKIDPLSIVRGEPSVTLHAADGGDTPRGVVTWRDPALTLDAVAFTLPAAALRGLLAAGNALELGGYVAVDAPHTRWGGTGSEGSATAVWSGARIAGAAGTLALGTVSVDLAPRGGRIQGRLENRGGDVRVGGEFAFDNTGVEVNMTITPLPSTPPAVSRALGALGTPNANGVVRVQWRSNNR